MKHFRLLRWVTVGLLALAAIFAGHIMVRMGIAADEYGTAFAWSGWPPYAQWTAFLVPLVLLVVIHCLFAYYAGEGLGKKEKRAVVVCVALSLAVVVGSCVVSVNAHVSLNRQAEKYEAYCKPLRMEWSTEHFHPVSLKELSAMQEEKYTGIVYITTSGREENVAFHDALQELVSETHTTMKLYDACADQLARKDAVEEVLKQYGVSSLPAILVLSEGVATEQFEGAHMLEDVTGYLANP